MKWWSPWLGLAGLAYVALAVVWIENHRDAGRRVDPPQGQEEDDEASVSSRSSAIFAPFSVLNTAPEGLSQAFEYLRRRRDGGPVEVLGRDISSADQAADGVVFRVSTGWTRMTFLDDLAQRLEVDEASAENGEDGETSAGETSAEETSAETEGDGKTSAEETSAEETSADETAEPQPAQWRMPSILSPRQVEWVRGGGRLVIAFAGETADLRTEEQSPEGSLHKVFPTWPEVDEIRPPIARSLAGDALRRTHAVLLWDDAPLLSRWPLGRGEIIWLATPEVLQNEHLAAADHLALLTTLAGEGRPVYFDETLHGIRHSTGTLFLLGRWRLIPWLCLWIVACLAVWWRRSKSVGPPEDPYQERRSEAVDMVDSLAALYGRALRRRDALELYHRELVEHVGWRLGLSGREAESKTEELLDGPLAGLGLSTHRDISVGELRRQLQRINQAFRRIEHGNRF